MDVSSNIITRVVWKVLQVVFTKLTYLINLKYKIMTSGWRWLGKHEKFVFANAHIISTYPHKTGDAAASRVCVWVTSHVRAMAHGPKSFKVSGPTISNDLPPRLKDSFLSRNSFKKLLKRFLFIWWLGYICAFVILLTCAEKCKQ